MTGPQHMTALALANQTRRDRYLLRARVRTAGACATPPAMKGSLIELATILDDGPPACMASMRVVDAVRWVWRIGPGQVEHCLRLAGCSEFKLVGELSPRQRVRLVDALTGLAYRRDAA